MPIPGICGICHKISRALLICVYCGNRVCIECMDSKIRKCNNCQKKNTL